MYFLPIELIKVNDLADDPKYISLKSVCKAIGDSCR